jgi:hypothetical protein
LPPSPTHTATTMATPVARSTPRPRARPSLAPRS